MRYAKGAYALGICDRCGLRAPYNMLVADGQTPGSRVHPTCRDEKNPQEKLLRTDEGILLKNPRPDRDDDTTIIHSGTATGGGASSITLASSALPLPGLYLGNTVTLTGGTGSGQSGTISGYDTSTRVATVSSAWSTPPDATSTYRITASRVSVAMQFTNSFGGAT